MPRSTADLVPPAGHARAAADLAQARLRARGTPSHELHVTEHLRALIFAPDPGRQDWIEGELSRAPIPVTIQIARRVRTVVAALLRDPPPRPEVLIVDFDAISGPELLELHAIRHEGWFGRVIGLGHVPPELCASLGIDHVIAAPLIRDSLLDTVAGTRHAAVTAAIPVIPR
jgi:hypothetical protein